MMQNDLMYTQNVKGTSDYTGDEQRLRRRIRNLLEEQFRRFGYEEAETSVLSELDWLTSKYGGGEEITREIYQLSDQRGRKLGLRYDLTMPLARLMTLHPGIRLPYRRFEMGKVFRDGPTKRGRLREFWQCDADVIGIAGPEAELELFQLVMQAFAELEIPITIRWNNRKLLGEVLHVLGVPESLQASAMLTLDKLAKISRTELQNELRVKGLAAESTELLMALIERSERGLSLTDVVATYALEASSGATEALELARLLKALDPNGICQFDLFLSRGLSFYTGTVYEIFDASGQYPSSLGSGGRYDRMIGKLAGREELELPAVGLSFGLESIMELYRQQPRMQQWSIEQAQRRIAVVPLGNTLSDVLRIAGELRTAGMTVETDTSRRRLGKLMNSLYSRGIQHIVLVGETEIANGEVVLRDLSRGEEWVLPIEAAIHKLTCLYG